MQKTVDSISAEERQGIVNRWVSVRYEQGFDYALFWKIGLGVLALLIGFYAWNRKLSRLNFAIQRAQAQTQAALDQVATLLDNCGQGFLAFGRDLAIEPGHSRECDRIFGRPLPGRTLPDVLCADDGHRQRLLAKTLPLAMDAADALQRDAYLDLLPKEYMLGERSYKADYRLLQGRRMMLVLTDVSAEKRLRERLAQERQRLEFIVHALENRVDVLSVLRDFEAFRGRTLPDLLSFERDPKTLLSELYRHVHTFKSLFAQIGLPTMPDRLHALENRFADLRAAGDFDANDIKRELGAVELGATLERDLAVLRDTLGDGYFSAERELHIAATTLAALEREAGELYGTDSRMLALIRQLGFEPIQALIGPACKAAEQLARRQGKQLAPIACTGEPVPVDPAVYAPFCKTLVHVFRNAVDHGIEDADTRLLADKDETARIRCDVRVDGEHLRVTIADDGGGLDPALVRRKAVARGLLDAADAETVDDAQVLQLIFAESFSTRDEVSAVSGRGIGLAAVAQELQRLGGMVRVESTPGAGTRFAFDLPYAPLPAALPSTTPLQRTTRLLAPLPKVMDAFCRTHLSLPVSLDGQMREFTADMLRDFTAVVPLGGELRATLGLSIDRPLLLEMTRRFEAAFAEDEIPQLADSVGAEIANTIVGNATVYYTPFARKIAMGTPEVIGDRQRAERFGRRAFRGYAGRGDAGSFILFCTLAEDA